jgi:transcriptional regulator with XRE-family HTH domain
MGFNSPEEARKGIKQTYGTRTKSNLIHLRRARGWNQTKMSGESGVSLLTLRKAERGYLLDLRIDTIVKLANALGVGAADIFPALGSRLRTKRLGSKQKSEGN